ncbi:MAG: hypothetical protein Q9191_007792, partial [Dirinaria sp. TL-2023a]
MFNVAAILSLSVFIIEISRRWRYDHDDPPTNNAASVASPATDSHQHHVRAAKSPTKDGNRRNGERLARLHQVRGIHYGHEKEFFLHRANTGSSTSGKTRRNSTTKFATALNTVLLKPSTTKKATPSPPSTPFRLSWSLFKSWLPTASAAPAPKK